VMGHPMEAGDDGYKEISPEQLAALLKGKDAIAIGPGIPKGKGSLSLILKILETFDGPVVLDADALNLISGQEKSVASCNAKMVLTPHPGELSRLIELDVPGIQENRVEAAKTCSDKYKAVTLLKGAGTITCAKDCLKITINTTGNPGMASGGMGDVLTGMIGALAAGGMDVYDAARLGAYIHGLSADNAIKKKGKASLIASDVIEGLQEVFAYLEY